MKAVLLSVLMLSGIALWGAAIYAGDASARAHPVDGYGVVSTAAR